MFKQILQSIGLVDPDPFVPSAEGMDWWNNPYNENDTDRLTRVIIEPKQIDFAGIQDQHFIQKKFEFRPQTWEQFIGQPQAKERAKIITKQFERGMRSHIILTGLKGHGKTSYIELLAKQLDAKFIQRIGKQIDENTLIEVINEINTSDNPRTILFIDEIDSMSWKLLKIMNPIIESFQIAGKRIRPFIFACATINKSVLLKKNPDTLDRITHHINFSRYSTDDLCKIIHQYKNQLYPDINLNDEDVNEISLNCKYNPRTAINLLEVLVIEPDIKNVFANCRIIKDGLTDTDIKILNILSESKKPMGANAIATRCGIAEQEYIREYESFLYEFEYLQRTPSRSITDKGKDFLKSLKN